MRSIEEGDIIDVRIERVQDFGISVDYNGEKGFIQIINLAWDLRGMQEKMYQLYSKGQIVRVKVLDTTEDKFYASIKGVKPAQDPWREPLQFKVGAVFNAVVDKIVDFGCFVELEDDVLALMPNRNELGGMKKGDSVKVVVTNIDLSLKKIEVNLISQATVDQ